MCTPLDRMEDRCGNTNSKAQAIARKDFRPAITEQRLKELGLKLPAPLEPFGTNVEVLQRGDMLFLAGMLPTKGRAAKFVGRVGAEPVAEAGFKAARLVLLNLCNSIRKVWPQRLAR
jgi:hypothetical protein